MKSAAMCSMAFVTISNPAGGAVGVSQSYGYKRMTCTLSY